MSTTVQQVITRARGLVHDRLDSHYIREFLQEQANGVNLVFQLRNRNVVQLADGAPADLVALVNGVVVAITGVDKVTGLVTLVLAPAALAQVEFRYFFLLNTDEEFLDFVRTATEFVGSIPTFTLATDVVQFPDNLVNAAVHDCAASAGRAMASLTHWYYNANAGNKTFNKDPISKKFSDQANDFSKRAVAMRDDPYTRFSQAKAPAFRNVRGRRGLGYWEPQR